MAVKPHYGCRKCSFRAKSPIHLGKHHKNNPGHRTDAQNRMRGSYLFHSGRDPYPSEEKYVRPFMQLTSANGLVAGRRNRRKGRTAQRQSVVGVKVAPVDWARETDDGATIRFSVNLKDPDSIGRARRALEVLQVFSDTIEKEAS